MRFLVLGLAVLALALYCAYRLEHVREQVCQSITNAGLVCTSIYRATN